MNAKKDNEKKNKTQALPLDMEIIPKRITHQHLPPPAQRIKSLITSAQEGDKNSLTELCQMFEPLFIKEMKREIFYSALGFDEGISLARLKFIELVLSYNGADFIHFAGYVRCRIHYALYDEVRRIWDRHNNEAPLADNGDDENTLTESATIDNPIEREELSILLNGALKKLTERQRTAVKGIYFEDRSNKELAAELKITPAMVTKHHQQALKNLKAKIA